MLIDTHTHLYVEEFENDYHTVINNAKNFGVKRFYLPAIDSSYHQAMYNLENQYPKEIKLMMGLHPTYVKKETIENELLQVKEQLKKRPFSAIGEIGIDLYWDTSTLELQKYAFKKQIKWAKNYKLPIVIHSRDSFNEIFEILEQERSDDLFGIFHCFTGTQSQAEQAVSLNFKLGIGGVITFKNGKIDQYMKNIPLKNIVLETDAPYLAPTPYRGKRNEPLYLKEITEKISEVYSISIEQVYQITTENALSIFKEY